MIGSISVNSRSEDGKTVSIPLPHSIGVFHDYERSKSSRVDELSLPSYYDPLGECFLNRLQTNRMMLKHLIIPPYSCQRITYFQLDGYESLETVEIGYNSFFPLYSFSLPASVPLTSPVRITNCPSLRKISMEGWSFAFSSDLVLESMDGIGFPSRFAVLTALADWHCEEQQNGVSEQLHLPLCQVVCSIK